MTLIFLVLIRDVVRVWVAVINEGGEVARGDLLFLILIVQTLRQLRAVL
jgi:hypothetical protein